MRRVLFVFLLFLTVSPLMADPEDPWYGFFKKFCFQLGPGLEFQGQNFKTLNRDSGWGGELGIGYRLDDRWSFWLTQNAYVYNEYNALTVFQYRAPGTLCETSLSARYKIPMGNFKPYLFAGGGVFWGDYQTYDIFTKPYAYSPASVPMIVGGLGLEYSMDPKVSLFFETKANVIFQEFQTYTGAPLLAIIAIDYPVNVGVIFNP